MAEMLLNETDISYYNARLYNYSVSGTTISNTTNSAGKVLKMPALYSFNFGTRTLTITLTFFPYRYGSDSKKTDISERYSIATENISRFEAEIVGKVVEISLPDGYIYTALVSSVSAADFDTTGEHDVTYTFSAIRHKSPQTINVLPNNKIFCDSTTDTAFKAVIKFKSSHSLVCVLGINVKNVTKNSKLIIDSENGLITLNGVNKFLDTNLNNFPYLKPGYNTIDCSENADITIVYTPVFI